ncbi:hypothetical protein WA158_001886 [Blastocystis sp. Blastoise]
MNKLISQVPFFAKSFALSDSKSFSTGIVKSWGRDSGYGFVLIDGDDTSKVHLKYQKRLNVYVHYKDIDMPGYKYLTPGNRVYFDLVLTDNGPKGVHVQGPGVPIISSEYNMNKSTMNKVNSWIPPPDNINELCRNKKLKSKNKLYF